MPNTKYTPLDPERLGDKSAELREHLQTYVIGQPEASETVVGGMTPYFAGLVNPNRPISVLLFLGQTGVGKTLMAEEIARHVLGSVEGLCRIACESYTERHTIFNLVGSPKSYVGYGDSPRLSQVELNKWRRKVVRCSGEPVLSVNSVQPVVLLFDEIDKASPALHQILLGILETGKLTLSDGDVTDFSKAIIIMTANWGGREISKINSGDVLGFTAGASKPDASNVAIAEANKMLSPELLNRIDKTVVFKSLDADALSEVCEIELGKVQRIVRETSDGFLFSVTEKAKQALIAEGTSPKFGARELKRVIDRRVTQKLANLVESHQVTSGGIVRVDYIRGKFTFALRNIVVPWTENEVTPKPESKPLPVCPIRDYADDDNILSDEWGYPPLDC